MNDGFVVSSATLLNSGLENTLSKFYERCRGSLKSMAAIQEGKYGFDPLTATFYSTKSERPWAWTAEVMLRKAKGQSINTVVGGIEEVRLDLISTMRVISCQVAKDPIQLGIWEVRLPALLQEVKDAIEGLQRLRKSYEKHTDKLKKLDKAREEFEKEVHSSLKALGEKLAQLKASPPKLELKLERPPLEVVAPFEDCYSDKQLDFLASFLSNIVQQQNYLQKHRVKFQESQYQIVKSSPGLPWSYAVTPKNNTMLHFHVSPFAEGRSPGSAFKTIKLGYFLEQNEHIVKLTTRFDFAELAGKDKVVFELAKKEQGFLKRLQEAPHPNVAHTYEICWRNKTCKKDPSKRLLLQIIYQRYGKKGDLYCAWDQVIHDNVKVSIILKGLISGLCHLHSLGIVVNDIKLKNTALDEKGNPFYIDFNCSYYQDSPGAQSGTVPFTDLTVLRSEYLERKYMKAHPSRDIWSLGLIFYLLLFKTKSIPWWPLKEDFSAAGFERIIQEKARLFPEPPISQIWKHACWEMLRIDPQMRPTAQALKQRLMDQPLIR